jgi:hypothetical protein
MTGGSSGESYGGRGSVDDGAVRVVAVRRMVRRMVGTVMRTVITLMILHHQMVVLEVTILGRTALSMDSERDELGTSDVASEVLGIILSIAEFGVLGEVE